MLRKTFFAFLLIAVSSDLLALELTEKQALMTQQLSSVFENGTIDFEYSYIEDIKDGAGITCGRSGFTGLELKIIVGRYASMNPLSPLAQYLPCLETMGDKIMADYSCLFPSVSSEVIGKDEFKSEGGLISQIDFGKAWVQADDVLMRKIQDDYNSETYLQPALRLTESLGLKSALAAAFIYDACIQMGCSSDLFKLVPQIFAERHGGRNRPMNLQEEYEWLTIYIPARVQLVSSNPAGAATVGREKSLEQILNPGNMDLSYPLIFDYYGNHYQINP